MSEPIKTTHEGVEIIYLEDPNRWRFTVNGRERSAESLTKAREAIERALYTPKKGKAWEPFEAYLDRYGHFVKVTVTSVAEASGRFSRSPELWINRDGQRRKESLTSLFKVCPENEALFAELVRLDREQERIDEQKKAARERLVNIELAIGEGED